ncbi:hypothetical protein HPB49_019039 [Dermacentor silvarum]|uniref:Uncharacterized protein n=1 Tax=Dermacentor silvarum TaxID=543639 RepID=A0ACB8CM75_DERSI|nr:hypothetical protein HPB49_019039 [Dermacentor silvarum]
MSPDNEEQQKLSCVLHINEQTDGKTLSLHANDMPVQNSELYGQIVSVLRDTGSNTIVVRRALIPDTALTGTTAIMLLADGRGIEMPEAEVEIHSPYFSGTVVAKCLENPLYDIIIGNIAGSRQPTNTDDQWKTPSGKTIATTPDPNESVVEKNLPWAASSFVRAMSTRGDPKGVHVLYTGEILPEPEENPGAISCSRDNE